MITDEQIKNLKSGDTVLVEAKVDIVKSTGIKVLYGSISPMLPFNKLYSVPEQPKHDPCRKFKEGDIVRPKENVYLEPYAEESLNIRDRYIVERVLATGWLYVSAENERETFEIWGGMLELVTPVEEREPYSVHESEVIQGFDIIRDKLCVMTFPFGEKENGWYHNRLASKAAAEAERDRLNAEWKKLQI